MVESGKEVVSLPGKSRNYFLKNQSKKVYALPQKKLLKKKKNSSS